MRAAGALVEPPRFKEGLRLFELGELAHFQKLFP
jgi:hypothetical protein